MQAENRDRQAEDREAGRKGMRAEDRDRQARKHAGREPRQTSRQITETGRPEACGQRIATDRKTCRQRIATDRKTCRQRIATDRKTCRQRIDRQ